MTCERVIIIHDGKIAAEDNIDNLSSMVAGSRRIRLEVEGPSKEVARQLQKVAGVTRVTYDGARYNVEYPADKDLRSKITEAVVKNGWMILSAESVAMSLEDVFLKLTTEDEETED
jgi:ABC-2 type transport system ATP-binding protein